MAKRTPDSGLPRRKPGRALNDAADDAVVATKGPVCRHRSTHNGVEYVCAKNPGHLGDHTPVRADGVIATYLDPDDADPLAAATSPPPGVAAPEVDPTPVVPDAPAASEPSDAGVSLAELSGSDDSGSGRPSDETDLTITEIRERWRQATPVELAPPTPSRSIGTVIAHTAIDAALGVPVEVQDERAHAREAVEILVEAAAEHHRHNQLMPVARLLDLEAVVAHMVQARGLESQIAATHGIDLDEEVG